MTTCLLGVVDKMYMEDVFVIPASGQMHNILFALMLRGIQNSEVLLIFRLILNLLVRSFREYWYHNINTMKLRIQLFENSIS